MNDNPIAVFLDGTGNFGEAGSPKDTNVHKLFLATEADTKSKHYVRGIASDPKPEGIFGKLKQKFDQALGGGATDRLQDAYWFISENYNSKRPLFLFGFSRGAFVASMLAGFLHRVGVLFAKPVREEDLAKAFYLYYHDEDGKEFADLVQQVEKAFGRTAEGIRTHFLGQWDTVETLDVAGFSAPSEQLLLAIAKRERSKPLPDWVDNACHALAIHEVRPLFEPNVWSGTTHNNQSLEQVWFAGAHADVGGGYTPEESKCRQHYAQISLKWMRDRACAAGLNAKTINIDSVPALEDMPTTPAPITFCGLPPRMRPILASMPPNNSQGFYLHDSVIERLWDPIEDAYSKAKVSMHQAWEAADDAAMRFHYSQFFGNAGVPELTPRQLKHDIDDLWEFLSGTIQLSQGELTMRLALALIFYLFPDRYILREQALPKPVINQLIPALQAVEAQLCTSIHKALATRRWEYGVYLEWMALTLQSLRIHHPGFKIVKKKVVKI